MSFLTSFLFLSPFSSLGLNAASIFVVNSSYSQSASFWSSARARATDTSESTYFESAISRLVIYFYFLINLHIRLKETFKYSG